MSVTQPIYTAQRIVIKLGTQVVIQLSQDQQVSFAADRLQQMVVQCATLAQAGKEIILVSSGAVGLGRQALHLQGQLSLNQKQACAAVGQSLLMNAYRALFEPYGLPLAQVLLTAKDFSDRKHYLNLRQTLETLLSLKVIPIINENDTTSTQELQEESQTKSFGDNDMLSALVASKLDADLLVILTNVDGIYTDNPFTNPQAQKIREIRDFEALRSVDASGQSLLGRGGMTSKIEAAKMASLSGVHTLIQSGLAEKPLEALLSEEVSHTGTFIWPQGQLSGKKRWIAMASGYRGVIVVNEGAKKALIQQQASLLPIGIVDVQGDFSAQQVVSIQTEQGDEIGRGLSHYAAWEVNRLKGLHSETILNTWTQLQLEATEQRQEVIHRDNLVVFEEYGL